MKPTGDGCQSLLMFVDPNYSLLALASRTFLALDRPAFSAIEQLTDITFACHC